MSVVTTSIIGVAILTIFFIILGLWFRKVVVSSEDFILAGRGAPFWLLASSYLGSYVGGASISGYMSNGFSSGIAQTWLMLLTYLFCTLFIILFGRRLNYFGRKTGAATQADFVVTRFGERMRLPIALVGMLRPAIQTGTQMLALSVVLNVCFGWEIKTGLICSAAVLVLYMITAGQYSAMVTQWIQGIFQSVGIVLFTFFVIKLFGSPQLAVDAVYDVLEPTFRDPTNIDFSMFTVWVLSFGFFYFIDPWMFMYSYTAKNLKTASNSQLAVLAGSYYGVIPYLAGLALAAAGIAAIIIIPEGLSSDALYAWFTVNNTPIAVGTMIIVGLIMTIVSTASSCVINATGILTRDIYQNVINKKATDKQALTFSRVSIVIVLVIGICAAMWLPELIPLWTLAQALVISGNLCPILATWFWKRCTSAGAFWSCVIGGAAGVLWAIYCWTSTGSPGGLMYGLHAAHVGTALSLVTIIVVSLATKPEYENADSTNWFVLGREMKANAPELHVPEGENKLFGWLGAKTPAIKALWVFSMILFILHYVLIAGFEIKLFGTVLVYLTMAACIVLPIVLLILGAKDTRNMYLDAKEARARMAAEKK